MSLSVDREAAVALDGIDREIAQVSWMESDEKVPFEQTGDRVYFNLMGYPYGRSLCVKVAEIKFK